MPAMATSTPTPPTAEGAPGRPAGPRGLHGRLSIEAERIGSRTRLVAVEAQPPLQVMAAHDVDPRVADLASLTVMSPSGGVLQGDRLAMDVRVGPAARLAVGTQSSVRVYRTPSEGAVSRTTLICASGAYLEYLPDPWVPFAGSRLDAETRCVVDASATLLVCEAVVAGRLARGERFALDRFESRLTVERPGGEPFIRDTLRIDPAEVPDAVGRFGDALAVATLFAIGPCMGPELLGDEAYGVTVPGGHVGASALPDAAGAWLRVLGPDARSVMAPVLAARAAVRSAVLGHAPPADRRP
jgi:urease accessory protein